MDNWTSIKISAILSLVIYFTYISKVCSGEPIGYGSSTSTLTSKNQENIFMGFELGFTAVSGNSNFLKDVIIENDRSGSQTGALTSLSKLLNNKVSALVGFSGSHDSVLVARSVADKNILLLVPGSNHNLLSSFGNSVFTTGHSMDKEVQNTIEFLSKKFKSKSGVVIFNKFALASSSIEKILDEKLKFKSDFTIEKVFLNQDLSLSEDSLKTMKNPKIKFIYVTTYPEALITAVSQLEKNNIDLPIVAASSWGLGDADLLRRFITNKKAPVFFSSEWSANSFESRDFTSLFKMKFGRSPAPENALGYDVGRIIATTIRRVKTQPSRESLLRAFHENLCFDNLSVGRMCFDPKGGHSDVVPRIYKFTNDGNIRM